MFRIISGRSCRRTVAVLGTLAAVSACSDPTAPVRVSNIILSAVTDTLVLGASTQLGANVLSASGSTISAARVTWTSSAPGVATVSPSGLVTALALGSATISVSAGEITRSALIVVRPRDCAVPTGPAITLGSSTSGNLAANPCRLAGTFTAVGYTLTLSTPRGVSLSLAATGFSSGIVLADSNGFGIASSPLGVATPRIRAVLEAGRYQVWVHSDTEPNAAHTFTLTASEAAGRCEDTDVSRTIDVGNATAAALTDLSCILLEGPVAEGWRLLLTEPTRIRVVATSAAFAPMAAIISADSGTIIDFNSAATPGTTSTIAELEAGEYLVWGGSFDFVYGTVQLAVEVVPPCAPSGALTLGVSVDAEFDASDCPFLWSPRHFSDLWTLTVAEQTTVRFEMSSTEFDTYIELRDSVDTFIALDDDSGEGTNSRLVRALAPGSYRLWVTASWPETLGAYTLTATAEAAGALRMERAPSDAISSPSAKPGRPARQRPWPRPRTS